MWGVLAGWITGSLLLRFLSRLEGFDDDHAAAAAGARIGACRWFAGLVDGLVVVGCGRWHGEQLARPRNIGGAIGVGEQAVVADAMEAFWEHVHQETTDELVVRQGHCLIARGSLQPIILPLEGDAVVIEGDKPAV